MLFFDTGSNSAFLFLRFCIIGFVLAKSVVEDVASTGSFAVFPFKVDIDTTSSEEEEEISFELLLSIDVVVDVLQKKE